MCGVHMTFMRKQCLPGRSNRAKIQPMMDLAQYGLIFVAAVLTAGSPGPATLAIAGTSMGSGRKAGLAVASGIITGSLIWSVSAAAGLSAIMATNVWLFEVMRYCGAAYLMYFAFRAARSALSAHAMQTRDAGEGGFKRAYMRGLGLHLTNPKAVFFFASLYSVGVPADATLTDIVLVIVMVAAISVTLFIGNAMLFSSQVMVAAYAKLRRWIEAVIAMAFGYAGIRVLTSSVSFSN